jgi:sugar lactone lactonase YvrE
MRQISVGILYALLNLFGQVVCETDGIEYVVVSQPRLASVVYIKVNVNQNGAGNETYPLVTSGLKYPLGVALDNHHRRLYVADPESGKVFWYNVIFSGGGIVTDGRQFVAASGGGFRWVTVDDQGTVFMTDEGASTISKVTAKQVKAMQTEAEIIYAGTSTAEVSGPAGIAADGSHLYWANKVEGTKKGCVVKGQELPPTDQSASAAAVASNVDKVFGVCSSQNNLFYSDEAQFVYGVKKNGGDAATVVDILVAPRGCAWDGDGTVYVADKGGNAIWSFPSAMHALTLAQSIKIYEMEDPFGIAIFVPPPPKPVQTGLEYFLRSSAPSYGLLAPVLVFVSQLSKFA